MATYKFGEIVLIKFPFTDNQSFKKRPALVIKDTHDGDIIVARITSKAYSTIYDVEIKDWNKNGLKLPSIIPVHKLASLEKDMIDLKLGEIDKALKLQVEKIFKTIIDQ